MHLSVSGLPVDVLPSETIRLFIIVMHHAQSIRKGKIVKIRHE